MFSDRTPPTLIDPMATTSSLKIMSVSGDDPSGAFDALVAVPSDSCHSGSHLLILALAS